MCDIKRLQRLQNTAARIVLLAPKSSHITPLLKSLHWLPVSSRNSFKVLLLTYKAINGNAPSYISDLLHPYNPSRNLRSSDSLLLKIPRTRLKTYGDKSFVFATPSLWNFLPCDIRSLKSVEIFKSKLKTHLFKIQYNV